MTPLERVDAVIQGRRPDRPPISFWYHFGADCVSGPAAVDAHVRHVETYELDFLKIMDDNRYPRQSLAGDAIASVGDLRQLAMLDGDEGSFGQQLELIRALAGHFRGRIRTATTIFSPWVTLRQLCAPDLGQHGPPVLNTGQDPRDLLLTQFLREAPQTLATALNVIASSLANFARRCLAAGADGIFLSVRDDFVDSGDNGPGVYDRLVRPNDLRILDAVSTGSFNMLHVCGRALDFRRFAEYPVHVINWADRYAGPSLAEVAGWVRPAICGGLDNLGTLAQGTPEECAAQVADALAQVGDRPILISPGCTFDPHTVPIANLHAVRQAVETHRSHVG